MINKFRAYDTKRKEWYGASDNAGLTFYGFALFGECTYFCNPPMDELQNIVIQQSTGKLDNNGVEIYEGDLVKTLDVIFQIAYLPEKGAFVLERNGYTSYNYLSQFESIEVVGNVFDNPEMIK